VIHRTLTSGDPPPVQLDGHAESSIGRCHTADSTLRSHPLAPVRHRQLGRAAPAVSSRGAGRAPPNARTVAVRTCDRPPLLPPTPRSSSSWSVSHSGRLERDPRRHALPVAVSIATPPLTKRPHSAHGSEAPEEPSPCPSPWSGSLC
jgi:hypothetical protein